MVLTHIQSNICPIFCGPASIPTNNILTMVTEVQGGTPFKPIQ